MLKPATLQASASASGKDFHIIQQPETRPISHEQLIVEVKGIYAGLVFVEQKCKEVDEEQRAASVIFDRCGRALLNDDQWQALIALHKTLLHEHHDFFLASQHPAASPGLVQLAAKYSMPARMWRHGIHSFLEILRHCLPNFLEHMLSFIYTAYSMMALLYETVPGAAFEDTWIECFGDLGRYRMAIEENALEEREVWNGCARLWYRKAASKPPKGGRLYHHLAILARPDGWQQLLLYARSLASVVPFPLLRNKAASQQRLRAFEVRFDRLHTLFFSNGPQRSTTQPLGLLHTLECDLLDYNHRNNSPFNDQGDFIALINVTATFDSGLLRTTQASKVWEVLAHEANGGGTASRRSGTAQGQKEQQRAPRVPGSQSASGGYDSFPRYYSPADRLTRAFLDDEQGESKRPSRWLAKLFTAIGSCTSVVCSSLQKSILPLPTQGLKRLGSATSRCIKSLSLCSILSPVHAWPQHLGRPPAPLPAPVSSDSGELSMLLIVGLSHCVFVVAVLLAARSLAKRQGPTPIYGSLMAVLAFGWWAIRGDTSSTLWSLWA